MNGSRIALLSLALLATGCVHARAPLAIVTEFPSTASAPSGTRLRLTASTVLVLADVPRGVALLSEHDDFLAAMTPLDRAIRLGSSAPSDEATMVARIAREVRAFTPDEVEALARAVERVGREIDALGLDLAWPATIEVVKTTGREEVDAPVELAYTRGQTIVVNAEAIASDPERYVRHELFHVLSRAAPSLRDALYATLGYRHVGPVTLPPTMEARRLTNPDSPIAEHAIRVRVGTESVDVANVLFATRPYEGGHLFDYVVPLLVAVDDAGRAVSDALGRPRVFAIEAVDGYFEQVGRNTDYVGQPEEILADDFELVLRRTRDVPSPEVLDRILAVLLDPESPREAARRR